jgi:hypothetical protein
MFFYSPHYPSSMTQADFHALMMFSLQSAGFDVPAVPDYSPWRSQYWSPEIQIFLRQQLPTLAEQLMQRDLAIPEKIKQAIANPTLHNTKDPDLQRQCEELFPATYLRLQQALIDQKRDQQRETILTTQADKAHRIIAQRESTQSLYTFTGSGHKVRRSFLSND